MCAHTAAQSLGSSTTIPFPFLVYAVYGDSFGGGAAKSRARPDSIVSIVDSRGERAKAARTTDNAGSENPTKSPGRSVEIAPSPRLFPDAQIHRNRGRRQRRLFRNRRSFRWPVRIDDFLSDRIPVEWRRLEEHPAWIPYFTSDSPEIGLCARGLRRIAILGDDASRLKYA